jgi:RNA polymerase sigma-70 factor (ECF subfamily)
MSDVTLVRELLAGREAAFDEFFAIYFPRLYRFAVIRLGGNGDAAEEIVQRVLIRSLARLQTFRGEAALFTWLCTFCRREIGLFEDRPALRDALEALAATDEADPETVARRRELCDLVQLTLNHLPGRYGDVLEWRYIQELSVDEIAARLGVGYKAAESLLSRARAAFRDGFSFS